MNISDEAIAAAARHFLIFAFDEGTANEVRQAKAHFNDLVNEAYRTLTQSALMSGFHRPTADEFRSEFIIQCHKHLRRKGTI